MRNCRRSPPSGPSLTPPLDYVREGDTLIVTKPDRLARSTLDLLQIAKGLEGKGVTLRILSLDLNTATPTGKLMLTVLGGIAAFERDLMLERQRKASPRPRLKGSTRAVPRPHDAKPLTWCASRLRAHGRRHRRPAWHWQGQRVSHP